ncbi:MAG: EAL domain-containing protein [Rhodospirillales bacterium]|nr:EAL domain-containing protein [Rhodospirillales bacterium]
MATLHLQAFTEPARAAARSLGIALMRPHAGPFGLDRAGSARPDRQMVRLTTALAFAVGAFVAVALPLTWYVFDIRYDTGRMQAELHAHAQLIEDLILTDQGNSLRGPDALLENAKRIEAVLSRRIGEGFIEVYSVIDQRGDVIAHSTPEPNSLPWPVLESVIPLRASGAVLGSLRAQVSIFDLCYELLGLSFLSMTLGAGAFIAFRVLPLRTLHEALRQVSYLANHDPLTGLPNRTLFSDRLEQALAQSDRGTEIAALLFVDLDHFKEVNDTLGHGAGDLLLKQTVNRVLACLRKTDTLARLGGDEFAIIQSGLKGADAAAVLAQRILETLAVPFQLDGHEAVVSGSIGIVLLDRPGQDPGKLLREVDLALYQAKTEGRGTYRFFAKEMNKRLLARKGLERDLRVALREGQFTMYYQPQIELASGRMTGIEALLRWQHPERGLIGPGDFIAVAEETALIVQIGEWALQTACSETAAWGPLRLSVNLSPAQFRAPSLAAMVKRALDETGFEPGRLELEITESVLLQETEATLSALYAIKELGVQIAMDDFGTGYSSLSYLRKFPFDKVKIDRSFISDLGRSKNAAAIVRAVVALSHSLGMRANAEGVETSEQARLLLAEGCEEVQGYFFGHPMSAKDFCGFATAQGGGRPVPSITGRVSQTPGAT